MCMALRENFIFQNSCEHLTQSNVCNASLHKNEKLLFIFRKSNNSLAPSSNHSILITIQWVERKIKSNKSFIRFPPSIKVPSDAIELHKIQSNGWALESLEKFLKCIKIFLQNNFQIFHDYFANLQEFMFQKKSREVREREREKWIKITKCQNVIQASQEMTRMTRSNVDDDSRKLHLKENDRNLC